MGSIQISRRHQVTTTDNIQLNPKKANTGIPKLRPGKAHRPMTKFAIALVLHFFFNLLHIACLAPRVVGYTQQISENCAGHWAMGDREALCRHFCINCTTRKFLYFEITSFHLFTHYFFFTTSCVIKQNCHTHRHIIPIHSNTILTGAMVWPGRVQHRAGALPGRCAVVRGARPAGVLCRPAAGGHPAAV